MKWHLPALLAVLTGALQALPAGAVDDEAERQSIGMLWQKQLLAPLSQQLSDEPAEEVAFPDKHRQRLLKNTATLSLGQLDKPLADLLPELNWGYATNAPTAFDLAAGNNFGPLDIRFTHSAANELSLPRWLAEALARRVQTLSLTRTVAKSIPKPFGWQQGVPDWIGNQPTGYKEMNAIAWAGPAVRDNAQYVETTDSTRIRIDRTSYSLSELANWAYHRGLSLTLSLDSNQPLVTGAPLPILARLAAPVWLVTPQGLVAARLTGMHTGNACLGGGWLELEVSGSTKPAIWAILFLPEETLARSAVVNRQKPPPDTNSDDYLVASRSQLTVSWSDKRLPTLTITAKQFRWRNYPQGEKDTPPILGTAWGSYIKTLLPSEKEAVRISATGTPECALQ